MLDGSTRKGQLTRSAFWIALESLQQWQASHIPGGDTPASRDVLIWLLKVRDEPRQLEDLYLSSCHSGPTVRETLRSFADAGLIELEPGAEDQRDRVPRFTTRFDEMVQSYREQLAKIALLLQSVDLH